METLTLILIVLGLIVVLVGSIMSLIAAFRQSVWWGLGSLLFPPVKLLFLILHWAEAKKGVYASLVGGVILLIGAVGNPSFRAHAMQKYAPDKLEMAGFAFEKAPSPDELNAQIQQQRESIEQREAKFAQDGQTLVQYFNKLNEKRKTLKSTDASTVTAFNAEAADYQARNAARQQASEELKALRAELETLLEQRSRQNAANAAKNSGKRVVMYSTATCPACTMAKSYFAQKGVPYEDYDVNNSSEARAEFKKLGGRGVPLILIGDERMEGFSAQRLDQLL